VIELKAAEKPVMEPVEVLELVAVVVQEVVEAVEIALVVVHEMPEPETCMKAYE